MNNIIEIELHNKDDYKNKFNNKRISKDLNTYILNETKTCGMRDKIILEIDSNFPLTEEEKEEFVKMVKLSYKDDLDELKLYENILIKKSIILMFFGVIVLLAYYFFKNIFFVSEFILIIGWLIIWESADIFLFTRTENIIKQTRRKQIINSRFIFKK